MSEQPTTWTTELGDVVTVWEASPEDWRWHVTAGNGEVLEQGEGHTRREDAVRAAVRYHPATALAGRPIPIAEGDAFTFIAPDGAMARLEWTEAAEGEAAP